MSRTWILLVAGALLACSGDRDEPAAAPPPSPAPTTASTTAATTADGTVSTEPAHDATLAATVVPQWSVAIEVSADGFGDAPLHTSVAWTGDPNDKVVDGPFGSYGACSGLRDDVAAYSVFVSGDDAVDAVGVWTATPVTGAGLYDAEVRLERPNAAPLTASGTMTILDGLQDGSFLAFAAGGGRIEGSFSCSGSEPPTPLRDADRDDAEAEVFAVLRSGDAERFVGLATDDHVTCEPAGAGVLRVRGDAAVGAITAIDLAAPPAPAARLRVAGTDYEFSDVDVVLDEGAGVSGAFSASNREGISVDGAFRCA